MKQTSHRNDAATQTHLAAFPGWTLALGVLAISALLDFAYFHQVKDFVTPDSMSYIHPAHQMLEGAGFVNRDSEPDTRRTPGYPIFLSTIFAAGGGTLSMR